MSLAQDFRDFVIKGNVLDLAVAVVMGAAFNALITALVADLVTPLIGIPGHVDFANVTYVVNNSTFKIGAFVNAIITFLSVSIAVFFFIIKPVSKLQAMAMKPGAPSPPNTKKCPYCFTEIPLQATRCSACTSKLSK